MTNTTFGSFVSDLMEKLSVADPQWLSEFVKARGPALLDDLFSYQAALGVVLGAGSELDDRGIENVGWLGASLAEIGRAVVMPDRFVLHEVA